MSRAAQVTEFGGLESIKIIERDVPQPGEGEVLVRITTAGFHPLDGLLAAGAMGPFQAPAPLVLGCNGAGRVESDGATFKTGDRVAIVNNQMGMVRDGVWADHAAVPESVLLKLPDNVDDATAAGIGISFPTAVIALNMLGLASGSSVLITGANGAVGSAAIQLARTKGLVPFAVVRSQDAAAFCTDLGAEGVIDLSQTSIEEASKGLSQGGFDGCVDPIGGPVGAGALKGIKPGAAQVTVGYSSGFEMPVFLPDIVNYGRRLLGGNMASAGQDGLRAAEEETLAGLASGALRSPVATTVALDDVATIGATKGGTQLGRTLISVE
ncbi:unannotated protein [freshwater metagenome]|uniref:Unannotated protein n=1 Tax=freshwater metagenome TaxID=449393 RepID=A0A6J7J5G5_9ZZZZ|nr:zinc-binding dehydrogenase [Actinomycetota bacterium]